MRSWRGSAAWRCDRQAARITRRRSECCAARRTASAREVGINHDMPMKRWPAQAPARPTPSPRPNRACCESSSASTSATRACVAMPISLLVGDQEVRSSSTDIPRAVYRHIYAVATRTGRLGHDEGLRGGSCRCGGEDGPFEADIVVAARLGAGFGRQDHELVESRPRSSCGVAHETASVPERRSPGDTFVGRGECLPDRYKLVSHCTRDRPGRVGTAGKEESPGRPPALAS